MSSTRESSKSPETPPHFNFDGDDAITLHVGPTEHVLVTHASFLARNSEFFKAALKKEWSEGKTRVIKLPEEQPHVVSHYLRYIYGERLPIEMLSTNILSGIYLQPKDYFELLAELYVLGERLMDESIRTAVLKELLSLAWRTGPVKDAANVIYHGMTLQLGVSWSTYS